MAFSDAFAKGYAIGDAAKKRRATSKYFEKFKELTNEDEEAGIGEVTDIGGIPVPKASHSADEGDSALPAPGVVPVTGNESAIPVQPATDASPDAALVSDASLEAMPAIDIEAPEKIIEQSPEKAKKKQEARKSLSQQNMKDLDRLAMDAARASGDIEVYTALQKTTDSFLQGKVMKNLGLAQSAAQNGETADVERYMNAAYRYIPDGNELNIKKKDGKLFVKDPWDDKDVELSSEMIGNFGTMIRDPEKWADIVRTERKDRAKAKVDEREVAVKEGGLAVDQKRVEQFGTQLGMQERETKIKENQDKLSSLMAPIERMAKFEQGLYYRALSEQAKATAKDKLPEFLDEARLMSESIEKSMDSMITPPKEDFPGQKSSWQPSSEVMVNGPNGQRPLEKAELDQAKGIAQTIAMENKGVIGNQIAMSAALQLSKAQIDPANFNVQIDPSTGVMLVPFRGMNVPVKLPAALVQSLAAAQQSAQQQQSQQGSPYSPDQYMSPGG